MPRIAGSRRIPGDPGGQQPRPLPAVARARRRQDVVAVVQVEPVQPRGRTALVELRFRKGG